jgi:hypothetical protein
MYGANAHGCSSSSKEQNVGMAKSGLTIASGTATPTFRLARDDRAAVHLVTLLLHTIFEAFCISQLGDTLLADSHSKGSEVLGQIGGYLLCAFRKLQTGSPFRFPFVSRTSLSLGL